MNQDTLQIKEDPAWVDFYIRKFPRPKYKQAMRRVTTATYRVEPLSCGQWNAMVILLRKRSCDVGSKCSVIYYITDKKGCLRKYVGDNTVYETDYRKAKKLFNRLRKENSKTNRSRR